MTKTIEPAGTYKLDDNGFPKTLSLAFNHQGELVDSQLDETPITGNYDVKTGKIEFSEKRPILPGVGSVSYSGYIMPSLHRGKLAIAGTCHRRNPSVYPPLDKECGWFGEQFRIGRRK